MENLFSWSKILFAINCIFYHGIKFLRKIVQSGIHKQPFEKSEKYEERKCTKVTKRSCVHVHFLLLIVILAMGMNSPVTIQKWYP